MKKLLITALIVLLLIFIYVSAVQGIHVGPINIYSILELKEKNENIDTDLEKTSKLVSTDYKKSISELNATIKKLEKNKADYNDLVKYTESSQLAAAIEVKDYKIEYLWSRVSEHADREGVRPDMVVKTAEDGIKSADGRNLYDIHFSVIGSYIGTSLFISSLENDETLDLKIENFKMAKNDKAQLTASFVVRNIPIDLQTLTAVEETPTGNNVTSNKTTTNTTTTTTTNNTTAK